MLTDLH